MKKISISILVLMFFSIQAFADVYEHPVYLKNPSSTQIPKMGSIKCKFRQEKYIKNIDKLLISSGDFEFIENKGVYFYTQHPIKSITDYTNKNYNQINEIVNAISTKRYSKLEKEFEFFYKKDNSSWNLGMKPRKNSDAYNFISSITVTGTDYIRKISIQQKNGNKTILWFTK